MARKETITRETVRKGAFDLLREEGADMLTARKLAAYIGCSTQPIFRLYENMDKLISEVFAMAREYYEEYYKNSHVDDSVPFVGLSLAYVNFAKTEKNMFEFLFMSKNKECTLYELINGGDNAYVIKELKKIPNLKMDKAEDIFTKVFIFMHGFASMTICGEFDVSEDEARSMLTEAIKSFL